MMGGVFYWVVYKHGPCRLLGGRIGTRALTTQGKGQWSGKFTTGHKIVQTHGSLKWRQNFLGMGKMVHYVFRQSPEDGLGQRQVKLYFSSPS